PIESISGSLSEDGDVDLYQIYLSGDGTFSASTVDLTRLDTQLFLFSAPDGLGIYGNDDDANCAGCRESTLPAQNLLTPTEAGIYYLAVSEFANNPLAESGEEIFPNSFDDVDVDAIKAPTGPGGTLPLAGWTGNVVDTGDYVIRLTGVESGPVEITTITEIEEIIGFLDPELELGDAGDINIFADTFNLTNGATLQTNTAGSGDAGTIALTIDNTLNLERGNIAANTGDTASGRGGNIEVEAGRVRLSNSSLTVNSQGQGIGGDILVVADSLFLKQGSAIDAATASSDGGNIDLTLEEVLLLSGQSEITATAGIDDGDGNGGDIDIQSEFVIAAPDGPNRITANAFEGNGGNINIATTSLFGEEFLEISASSRFGLQGTVTLDSPDIDPARSLTELPTTLVDASNLIADACLVDGSHGQSQFVATGRGGLPTQPTSYPTGTFLLPDLGPLATAPPNAPTTMLQEAQSWSVAANGDIVLAAANPTTTLDSLLWNARQAYQQADYATAVTLWREAVETLAPSNDPLAYASTLSNLALAHHHLGEWGQAQSQIATIQQVLTPELATTTPWLVAQTLNTQASLQLAQGHAQAALDTWQHAVDAYALAGNAGGELQVRLNQTQAWQSLGFYPRAEAQLEAIATTLADQSPSSVQALALLHWGTALRARGETERSQQTLASALAVTQTLNKPTLTSAILLNLGHTAQAQAHTEKALSYYQDAAATAPTALAQFQAQVSQLDILATQDAAAAKTLGADLAHTLQTNPLPTSREGIYAQLHLAATLLQTDATLASPDQIMNLLLTADQQAQRLNDTPAQTYILGYQAQVYRQTQQWAEAQALTEEALHQAQILEAPAMIYQWAEQLGQLRRQQGDRAGAIAAYTEAVNALDTLRGDLIASSEDAQFTFRDTVEPVYRELVKLLLQDEAGQPVDPANLTQARRLIEDLQLAELQDYFQDACVQATPIVADEVDPTAAVIYPILLDDRLDVIVSVAGQPVHHHSTPISADQVEQTAYELLDTLTTALGSGQASTTQQLQQVYDWILAPVEAALEQQPIETLVFVADGVLRTLPLTALHDGEQYLVEQYNVVLSPGLNLLNPQPLQRQDLRMLAGGISESRPGFPPLPFVTDELQQITTQIPDHQLLVNQDLTQANLAESLATAPASVVHLATHGTFGTSAEDTFILTWDGKLNIKELSSLLQSRNRSSNIPIELLVFSACRTAEGDSRAVLGIAGMAIRSGVRSALAGLWPLDDRATAVFMDHFYKALAQPEVTKADAFRQAQLALMQDSRFSTPYYWSPFVMVGNWL
ncbi:MAG: CHAT domain-containing protein, partial [Leptolyngbya sp. SIO3F4]|nr:CHAT domain-containing protein [Leptolyngbya sp. SIO3F4]